MNPWQRFGALTATSHPTWLLRTSCHLANAPLWWSKGRARTLHRSYAEVELLSRLAEVLMPSQNIGELFRDFPVDPSEKWGSRWLCPDITAYGVLKDKDAALFVEYDGHYGHYCLKGHNTDERKTNALLEYAPAGSRVLRIRHAQRKLSSTENSIEVIVNQWRAGHMPSLSHVLCQTVGQLLNQHQDVLRADVCKRLHAVQGSEMEANFFEAGKFASQAIFTGASEINKANVLGFLEEDLELPTATINALASRFPRIWGTSIDGTLKASVAWLQDVGLSRAQVAKVVAVFPPVLGLSIEANLKPTLAWLEDVGLSRPQVAKVVARYPQVLGYSIEANLKPTVAWLEDVGLSRTQLAKVVAIFPQVLGLSIEANLKPTLAWLEDVGLSRPQVAKVVAGSPQVLGLSIEANLKPTVAWLEGAGLSRKQVAKAVANFPRLLSYSVDRNLSPKLALLQQLFSDGMIGALMAYHPPLLGYSYTRLYYRSGILRQRDCLPKLGIAMSLTDAHFARRFPV